MSVRAQTVLESGDAILQHWIVVDGPQFEFATRKHLGKMQATPPCPLYEQHILVLPENTGGSGYLCHRLNAALPFLVNTDYICFLDEDNAFEPDHVAKLLHAIRGSDARWAHSLRSIIDDNGELVCLDTCESLGAISHTCLGREDRLVDTNCYLLDRRLAIDLAPLWYVRAREPGVLEADRAICKTLLAHEPRCGISRHHTVRYRVNGRSNSVQKEFFIRGNALFRNPDFSRQDIYLFHFDEQRTSEYLFLQQPHSPLGEWCMTQWDEVRTKYNMFDGFANVHCLPRGAICLVSMCHPSTLPLDILKERTDLHRILYTAEGPNIRHQAQWSKEFLTRHFDVILTHWGPLLRDPEVTTILAPHNARFLSFPKDANLLRENQGPGTGSVVMVLERRSGREAYDINQVQLHCLDHLRETFIVGLRNATVYGNGWAAVKNVHVGYSMPRHQDTVHTPVDHYQKHDFALIIENCDAEGYISEKFGDALIAGAIPLYWGNPSKDIPLPEGAFIDIRPFQHGAHLQSYLDALDPSAVSAMKERVRTVREEWLASRGTRMVASAVDNAIITQLQ